MSWRNWGMKLFRSRFVGGIAAAALISVVGCAASAATSAPTAAPATTTATPPASHSATPASSAPSTPGGDGADAAQKYCTDSGGMLVARQATFNTNADRA